MFGSTIAGYSYPEVDKSLGNDTRRLHNIRVSTINRRLQNLQVTIPRNCSKAPSTPSWPSTMALSTPSWPSTMALSTPSWPSTTALSTSSWPSTTALSTSSWPSTTALATPYWPILHLLGLFYTFLAIKK